MKLLVIALLFIFSTGFSFAQEQGIHPASLHYEWPKDEKVLQKLDEWQDKKFGVIIHWGLYAVPGIVESWSICSEDWITRDTTKTYEEYKQWYFGLKDSFNPVNFNPERWAEVSAKAGMKYLVFTTKHHDGFSMFDTRQTDFNITKGPFAGNPKADVLKYVFDAYRKQGFMIGAYFSKPDWHNENYWFPGNATGDRNNNYDLRKYPWRWEKFKAFTHNQVGEILSNYGKVDILWLDGGWVRPLETVNEEVLSWGAPIPKWSQDIDMAKIASDARKLQPGLLIVDRTVKGEFENYQTPELRIPEQKIDNPWETCLPLCGNWGFVPGDPMKSTETVVKTLVEVIAKGGNLLLGIGPKADGTLLPEVEARLLEIGEWTNANAEAIYETRAIDHYRDGNVFFTGNSKKGKTYAFVPATAIANGKATVEWGLNLPEKGSSVTYLPTGAKVKWAIRNGKVVVKLPKNVANAVNPVLVFAFEKE